MKLNLSAVAVALAALAPVAHADVQTVFPDGYVVLSQADLQPIAGAAPEWEIRRHFPKPSFTTSAVLTPTDRAAAPANPALVGSFPQGFYAERLDFDAAPATGSRMRIAIEPAIEQTFPDGYRSVGGSVGAPGIVAAFPQPSFIEYAPAGGEQAVPVAKSSAEILATFPQPSSVSN